MAPESLSNVIALDLTWNNSKLECLVERYDLNDGFLYVSWNALECPENYVPIGNSVAYVWVPSGSTLRRYRARVDPAQEGFEWVDNATYKPGAMLILTLPPDYLFVYPTNIGSNQSPVRFKSTEDNRMALYWWFPMGRFQIIWHMQRIPDADIDHQCQILNEEARRRNPPSPPHIDRAEKHIPSSEPHVINFAPQWHQSIQVTDKATLVMGQQEHVDLSRKVKNVQQERVIHIGKKAKVSAPIVIADTIEHSFNTLKESSVDDEVKELLEQLLIVVNDINKNIPQGKSDDAEAMARDIEALVKEATSSKPRSHWYDVSLEGLKKAAINIGEIAIPVLAIVEKLTPLLLT